MSFLEKTAFYEQEFARRHPFCEAGRLVSHFIMHFKNYVEFVHVNTLRTKIFDFLGTIIQ
jgi:hypothetical protein